MTMKFDDVLEIATASTRRPGNERLGIEGKSAFCRR